MPAYLVVVLVVLGVNLLPAFGPATWTLLVLFRIHQHLNPVALVLLGALAAGTGRYVLATAFRLLRSRFSDARRANLAAAQEYLTGHRGRSLAALGLFALAPLPSAQLFEAAGVLGMPLRGLTVAFFCGRLVSYSLYVAAASIAERSMGEALTSAFSSPWGIALQVAMLVGVALLARLDWRTLLARRVGPSTTPGSG